MMSPIRPIAATLLLAAGSSQAAFVTFDNEADWLAAIGGSADLAEGFDAVTTDTIYGTGNPVTEGFVTLEVVDGPSDNSWRIDAGTPQFGSIPTVNGTTFATVLGFGGSGSFGDTQLSFEAISAFAFEYSGATYSSDDGRVTTSLGDSVILSRQSSGTYFLGVVYTGGETFTSITFDTPNNGSGFGAGIDNLQALTTPAVVPVPAGIWLLLSACMALGARRRRA
jgi:hypothetical protein